MTEGLRWCYNNHFDYMFVFPMLAITGFLLITRIIGTVYLSVKLSKILPNGK